MNYRQIILDGGKEKSLERFHPWVFSGAIKEMDDAIEEGEIVNVYSARRKYLGTGFYQQASISVQVFEFREQIIDEAYWKNKFEQAIQLRKDIQLYDNPNTNIFRLIHGEGDSFPGLVVDFYNGILIFQCYSIGIWYHKETFSKILKELMGTKLIAVYDKSSETLPKKYIGIENGYLFGEDQVTKEGIENGNKFAIDWETGQKTGFFIDQRENRKLLGQYSKGKKVLNAFCYSGGFSVYALNEGATEVHSLDSSEKAIELVDKNIELIPEHKPKHKSIVDDAVKFMQRIEPDYDIIILDPPAFAKHSRARHKAVQAYKRLNASAIKQIKSGGIIFTFSCSQVVDKFLFNKTIASAAIETGRKVKILHQLHQPADHPNNIFHPEGEYLKGLVLQVE